MSHTIDASTEELVLKWVLDGVRPLIVTGHGVRLDRTHELIGHGPGALNYQSAVVAWARTSTALTATLPVLDVEGKNVEVHGFSLDEYDICPVGVIPH